MSRVQVVCPYPLHLPFHCSSYRIYSVLFMESFSSVVLCSIDMVDDHFSKAKDLMRSASDTKKQFSASTELGPLPPPRHEYSWSDPLEMASPTRRESPGLVAEEQAPWPPTFPSEVTIQRCTQTQERVRRRTNCMSQLIWLRMVGSRFCRNSNNRTPRNLFSILSQTRSIVIPFGSATQVE